jgi:hypothetical protein
VWRLPHTRYETTAVRYSFSRTLIALHLCGFRIQCAEMTRSATGLLHRRTQGSRSAGQPNIAINACSRPMVRFAARNVIWNADTKHTKGTFHLTASCVLFHVPECQKTRKEAVAPRHVACHAFAHALAPPPLAGSHNDMMCRNQHGNV